MRFVSSNVEKSVTWLNELFVLSCNTLNEAADSCGDFIEDLHGFNDSNYLASFLRITNLDEVRLAWVW